MWYSLIESIGSEIAAEAREDILGEAREVHQAEESATPLIDRLRGARDLIIRVETVRGEAKGTALACGEDWVAIGSQRRIHIIPLHAVVYVRGLSYARPQASRLGRSLKSLLRELEGVRVTVECTAGDVAGEISRVGGDYVVISTVEPADWLSGSTPMLQVQESPDADAYISLRNVVSINSGVLDWLESQD